MQIPTLMLSLALAMVVGAEPLAIPNTLPPGHTLARRTTPDVDPSAVCGANYKTCGGGWCCQSTEQCAGDLPGGIPACQDLTKTTVAPTARATPYQNIDAKVSSMLALRTLSGPASPANTAGINWGAAALGGAGLLFL